MVELGFNVILDGEKKEDSIPVEVKYEVWDPHLHNKPEGEDDFSRIREFELERVPGGTGLNQRYEVREISNGNSVDPSVEFEATYEMLRTKDSSELARQATEEFFDQYPDYALG